MGGQPNTPIVASIFYGYMQFCIARRMNWIRKTQHLRCAEVDGVVQFILVILISFNYCFSQTENFLRVK